MLYLTGGGLNNKTRPILGAHSRVGLLAQPESMTPGSVRGFRWAADNGCFAKGASFDEGKYLDWLFRMSGQSARCLFATAPDVVGDHAATWSRSVLALPKIRALGYRPALVAQDGVEDTVVEWHHFGALFIGGSTTWKTSDAVADLIGEAKRRGKWVHMGRVNSRRRVERAALIGCDSVDGNYLGFGPDVNLPKLLSWLDGLTEAPHLRLYGLSN